MDEKITSSNTGSRHSGAAVIIRDRKFLYAILLTGLAAFALAIAFHGGITHLNGDASLYKSWLYENRLRFMIGYQSYEVPFGIFVNAVILEVSYLIALGAALCLTPRDALENHVLSFVFLSFLLYSLPCLLIFPNLWSEAGWSDLDVIHMYFFLIFPLPGAINYALRLLLAFIVVTRVRKSTAWTTLPWWFIFAPTASCLLALVVLFPFEWLTAAHP